MWATESKKVAGVEFVGLDDEAREQIRKWITLAISPRGLQEESASLEETQQVTEALAAPEPTNAMPILEPEIARVVFQNQSRHSIATNLVGVVPPVETQDAETVSRNFSAKSTRPVVTVNHSHPTGPVTLFSQETRYNREVIDHERTSGFRKALQRIGLPLAAVLLLSTFVFGYHLRMTGNDRQGREVTAAEKVPEFASDSSVNSGIPTVNPKPPLDSPGFVLQVGAMTHKENADVLAESLRQRKFSALVFRRGTGSLYRVVVGPYSDADSALRVKEELKNRVSRLSAQNGFPRLRIFLDTEL